MGMKKICSAFAVLCSLYLCGCSSMFDSSKRHMLRLEDSSAECRVGDFVIVSLDSNPTTGYDWTPVSYDESVLKIDGRRFIPARRGLVGSGGTTEISFLAVGEGNSKIKLGYARPWESKPAIKEANYDVKVVSE